MGVKDVMLVGAGVLVVMWLRAEFALAFYWAYFNEKQLNMGKDPVETMKEVFPWIWWVVR